MKTKHKLLLIISIFTFSVSSCYKDLSKVKEFEIPEVKIDTTGIAGPFSVFQNEVLKITPKVSREGLSDSELSYEWLITMIPYRYGYLYDEPFMHLSSKKDLDTIISLRPSINPYGIWYRVKDNKENLVYSVIWQVYINTSYGEGLLVADTQDGTSTDLSLIMGKDFTENYNEDHPKTMHHLYSMNNKKSINGLVHSMCYDYVSTTSSKVLFMTTNNLFEAIDLLDFSIIGQNLELSYDDQLTFNPTQVTRNGQNVYLINNSEIRNFFPGSGMRIGIAISGDYEVDKYLSIVHEPYNVEPKIVFYDKKNNCFKTITGYVSNNTKPGEFTYDASSDPFNPNDVPNLECLKANIGPSGNHYFVMKNKLTGKFQVYTLGSPGAKMVYDISSPEMEEAIGFVICENQEVVFFATKNKIYALLLAGATPRVELRYTMPAGEEITHIDMFRQAWYLVNPQKYVSGVGYKVPMDSHEMLLLVGSYSSDKKGKLYSIPLTGINTGNIDAANIKTYEGFGKIIGTVSQE